MIRGIHHISMKCAADELEQVRRFYVRTLGMRVCREWAEGIMIDSGNGLIEVFSTGEGECRKGAIRHVAFLTDNVDALCERIRNAGYEVFIEPNDRVIPSSPAYPIRMAFCYGPLGEEVELFSEADALSGSERGKQEAPRRAENRV